MPNENMRSAFEERVLDWENAKVEVLSLFRSMNRETAEEQTEKLKNDVLYVNGVHHFTALYVELKNFRKEEAVQNNIDNFRNDLHKLLELESLGVGRIKEKNEFLDGAMPWREPLTTEKLIEITDALNKTRGEF